MAGDDQDDQDDEADRFYPDVEEIVEIHDDIIDEDPNADAGLRDHGPIEYALDHVQHGSFGQGPETIHEEAFQLMRLLAANHPFVDGNKRTALPTAVYFYLWNGLDLEYQEELEAMLVLIAIREDFVNPDVAVEHLDDITEPWEVADFLEYFDVLEDLAENITERMGQDDDVEE